MKRRSAADREENFRRMAEARDGVTLPPDFDEQFEKWRAKRRLHFRLLIVLVILAVLTAGGGLALYLRHLDFLNHYACAENSGSWIDGRCQRLP
ncbi:hypothetical protein [Caulobacter sp. CCG-8]|uniref:hypothetical protein n=1 Tax=Caulobacter sp. CCG-8 TaxID=3127958 RepID=UPI00307D5A20